MYDTRHPYIKLIDTTKICKPFGRIMPAIEKWPGHHHKRKAADDVDALAISHLGGHRMRKNSTDDDLYIHPVGVGSSVGESIGEGLRAYMAPRVPGWGLLGGRPVLPPACAPSSARPNGLICIPAELRDKLSEVYKL